jgi:hypothetical protein
LERHVQYLGQTRESMELLSALQELGESMVTFASSGMDLSHAAGILEVAQALYQRTNDEVLTHKMAVLKSYLGLGRAYRGGDYDEGFKNALADLTEAVHSHLLAQLYINDSRSKERFQAVA